MVAIFGIFVAYRIYVTRPGTAARLQTRFAAVHTVLANKWYFDELIDVVVVRPVLWLGRFTDTVLERGVIAEGITGGTTGVVRGLSAAVRRLQDREIATLLSQEIPDRKTGLSAADHDHVVAAGLVIPDLGRVVRVGFVHSVVQVCWSRLGICLQPPGELGAKPFGLVARAGGGERRFRSGSTGG